MDALLFPLLLALLAGFMFLSMRKQKKRVAEMQEMQNSVSTGTRVQLTSGLFGTVIDASSPDVVDVEIATGVVTVKDGKPWRIGARLGVLRRDDPHGEVRWFEIDPCYVFHVANAYDNERRITVQAVRYPNYGVTTVDSRPTG